MLNPHAHVRCMTACANALNFVEILAVHVAVYFHIQIKVWIQLRIPKIEDGNNFGVSIQVSTAPPQSRTCVQ